MLTPSEQEELLRIQAELEDKDNCMCWPENRPCTWCEERKPLLEQRESELLEKRG